MRAKRVRVERQVKIFNGRFRNTTHIYIGAYSIADAARILQQAYDTPTTQINEITVYFSKGAWGNSMEGIKPERGAWVQEHHSEKPKRII